MSEGKGTANGPKGAPGTKNPAVAPPFIVGAVLLLWGFQNNLMIPALLMAAISEAARFQHNKWELSHKAFQRIANGCLTILTGFVLFYIFTGNEFIVLRMTGAMPFVFFPLYAAQLYSNAETVELNTLFPQIGKKKLKRKPRENHIHFSYPYLTLCLLAAASRYTLPKYAFFLILFPVAAWALWKHRPKTFPLRTWVSLMVIAGVLGFVAYVGVYRVNNKMRHSLDNFLSSQPQAPDQRETAIGREGTLEERETIVFRIAVDEQWDRAYESVLIREHTFDIYRSPVWYASNDTFDALPPEPDGQTWRLAAKKDSNETVGKGKQSSLRKMVVSAYLEDGEGLLYLPAGAERVTGIPVPELKRNFMGTVKVEGAPGLVEYGVDYQRQGNTDAPPGHFDTYIPPTEAKGLKELAEELELPGHTPSQIMDKVNAFFNNHFTYSLTTREKGRSKRPLLDFLRKYRYGHCEYFATATVLLLRAAGVPARYVSGFRAEEYSDLEERIVVREKHAHAWALVYIDGGWQPLDTTPAAPDSADSGTGFAKWAVKWAAKWAGDMSAYLEYRFLQLRWKLFQRTWMLYLFLCGIPAATFLFYRFLRRKKKPKTGKIPKRKQKAETPRKLPDSRFIALEQKAALQGLGREPGETIRNWLIRLGTHCPQEEHRQRLPRILDLHYRDRFGREGLTETEAAELQTEIKNLLETFKMVYNRL